MAGESESSGINPEEEQRRKEEEFYQRMVLLSVNRDFATKMKSGDPQVLKKVVEDTKAFLEDLRVRGVIPEKEWKALVYRYGGGPEKIKTEKALSRKVGMDSEDLEKVLRVNRARLNKFLSQYSDQKKEINPSPNLKIIRDDEE